MPKLLHIADKSYSGILQPRVRNSLREVVKNEVPTIVSQYIYTVTEKLLNKR